MSSAVGALGSPDADRTKVLWLIKGLGPGGAERLLVIQAGFADHDRFDYSAAFLVPAKDHLVPELKRLGVPSTLVGTGRDLDLRWVWRLRRYVRDGNFDVVHAHAPLPAAALRIIRWTLPKARRPRMVYTEHNEWGKHRRSTRFLNRITIGLAGKVFAVSKGVATSMPRRVNPEVLYHGVDVTAVKATAAGDEVRTELGVPDDAFIVGTVANLRWEKAYDVLLNAAQQVIAADQNVWFVSVGQGPLKQDLEEQHRSLGLGERFRFLGYREDATRVMSAFDLFCLPSRHEGLPVALMEAAALGIPVVATNVGGVGELVDESALIPPDDLRALVSRLTSRVGAVPKIASAESFVDKLQQVYGQRN